MKLNACGVLVLFALVQAGPVQIRDSEGHGVGRRQDAFGGVGPLAVAGNPQDMAGAGGVMKRDDSDVEIAAPENVKRQQDDRNRPIPTTTPRPVLQTLGPNGQGGGNAQAPGRDNANDAVNTREIRKGSGEQAPTGARNNGARKTQDANAPALTRVPGKNGQRNGQDNGQQRGQKYGQNNGNGQSNGQLNGQLDRLLSDLLNGQLNGQLNDQLNGQNNRSGQKNGQKKDGLSFKTVTQIVTAQPTERRQDGQDGSMNLTVKKEKSVTVTVTVQAGNTAGVEQETRSAPADAGPTTNADRNGVGVKTVAIAQSALPTTTLGQDSGGQNRVGQNGGGLQEATSRAEAVQEKTSTLVEALPSKPSTSALPIQAPLAAETLSRPLTSSTAVMNSVPSQQTPEAVPSSQSPSRVEPTQRLATSLALGGVAATSAVRPGPTPRPGAVAGEQEKQPLVDISNVKLSSVLDLGNLQVASASI